MGRSAQSNSVQPVGHIDPAGDQHQQPVEHMAHNLPQPITRPDSTSSPSESLADLTYRSIRLRSSTPPPSHPSSMWPLNQAAPIEPIPLAMIHSTARHTEYSTASSPCRTPLYHNAIVAASSANAFSLSPCRLHDNGGAIGGSIEPSASRSGSPYTLATGSNNRNYSRLSDPGQAASDNVHLGMLLSSDTDETFSSAAIGECRIRGN